MEPGGRHFQCEHTYTAASGLKGYPIVLRVRDDEGNLSMHPTSVKIP
jgi:hypothetical protein